MAKVLVIDDDAGIRNLLVSMLEKAGHSVAVAKDGRQGLATYGEFHPDLVICDIIMPEMEGIETIVNLKKINPEGPILAISGGGADSPVPYLEMAKKMGADKVLDKPILHETLTEMVNDLLGPAG